MRRWADLSVGLWCRCRWCCRVEGELLSFENLEEIRGLRSFKSIELKMKPGDRVRRTTDFLTSPGSVMLVHPDPAVVRADAEFIHDMSRQGRLLKVAA